MPKSQNRAVNQVFLMFQPNLYASNFLQYYENTFHIILKMKDSDSKNYMTVCHYQLVLYCLMQSSSRPGTQSNDTSVSQNLLYKATWLCFQNKGF